MNLVAERIMLIALNLFGLLLKDDLRSLMGLPTKTSYFTSMNVSLDLSTEVIIYIVFY